MSLERIPTYVDGFDKALGGGVPKGHVVLVCGTPGTMKTSLTFSILYNNVKHNGSKGLFIALEEGHDSLKGAMEDLGMKNIDELELYVLDVAKIRMEHKEEELTKNWIEILTKYIEQRVRESHFDMVAIDSLAALYSLAQLTNPRRDLFHFFGFLRELGSTTFLISEIPMGSDRLVAYQEDFLSDGILYLRQYEVGETDVQLRIRCVKMRRTNHDRGYFTLMRSDEHFMVTSAITE
ncbi:MAG: AAA family ATPase [Thermoplasmata archaeon]|nr:AAA family ATPase [Candidatus Thermoplasmatota archaeon]MCK4948622.1 AAA family ATPase [Thermoplasmata archaeon]